MTDNEGVGLPDPSEGASRVSLAVFDNGWWGRACQALSESVELLPIARGADGNAHGADVAARTANGNAIQARSTLPDVAFWLDNAGAGLAFTAGDQGPEDLHLLHESVGVTLVSHFIDPLVTTFQGMPWEETFRCLQSRSWTKAVWDRAQAHELDRFLVPNVVHLPMAAVDRAYCTDPLEPSNPETAVSFVGGQNTSFFKEGFQTPTHSLLAGTLAQAVRSDLPDMTFYDIYHELYGLGEPVVQEDDLPVRTSKAHAYFDAKLFYNAFLCIRNRDRFIVFLKRKMGDRFRLIGRGWDEAYGLTCEPALPSTSEYFNHFRQTAINLNFVNGNSETGLNMRHFEITAAGGFMLCPYQAEIDECFDVGKECDVFRSEAELLEKIEYYLSCPSRRADIALAGQQRTLSQHLYSHRLRDVQKYVSGSVGAASELGCPKPRSLAAQPGVIKEKSVLQANR